MNRILLFVLAAVAVVWTVCAQIRTCSSCGREAKDPKAAFCSVCGGKIVGAKPAEPAAGPEASVVPEKPAAVSRIAVAWDAVAADVAAARKCEAENQNAVAPFYYRNAIALLRLVPADQQKPGIAETLEKGIAVNQAAMFKTRLPCTACSGTGEQIASFTVLKGENTKGTAKVRNAGARCKVCEGTGHIVAVRSFESAQALFAQGQKQYEQQQKLNKRVACGLAWIPADWMDKLTVREQALIRTGVPVLCPTCQGFGRLTCLKCKGMGFVICTATGCKNGLIAPKQTDIKERRMGNAADQPAICPVCSGHGKTVCSGCQGECVVTCKKCSGTGTTQRCPRCTGEGILSCPKCKGTGEIKGAPCPDCKGEKEILCPGCRGGGFLLK